MGCYQAWLSGAPAFWFARALKSVFFLSFLVIAADRLTVGKSSP